MKYRVLFVSPTAELGGAERFMYNLSSMLLNNGHDVTVYIMSRGPKPEWEALKSYSNFNAIVKDFPSEKTSLLSMALNLFYISHTNKYDFVFSSHTHLNGALSLLRRIKLLKCDFLISRESTFIFDRYYGLNRYLFKLIYKYMYGSQDLIICQTDRMKSELIRGLGYKLAKKIKVIPNPVNINHIENNLKSCAFTSKPFPTTIVGCGRLIPLKQFDLLLTAFANVSSNFSNLGLVIIGEGEEQIKLQKMIKDLYIAEKVILTGRIVNPMPLFNSADIGIISSKIEGFPNVLLEMMASGTKKIITTPCTDGLNQLPHVDLLVSTNLESIEQGLRDALTDLKDHSIEYKTYIQKNRSIESFWHKTLKELKVN